jgi:NHL repeat
MRSNGLDTANVRICYQSLGERVASLTGLATERLFELRGSKLARSELSANPYASDVQRGLPSADYLTVPPFVGPTRGSQMMFKKLQSRTERFGSMCAAALAACVGAGMLSITGPSWAVSGDVTTFAGTSLPGFANGPAATAKFLSPRDVAFDGTGNLLVLDNGNSRIRKIDASGNVTTFAGSGTRGLVNGPALSAQFESLSGIAVDNAGNVFVSDSLNNVIRKVGLSGTVTTFAGKNTPFAGSFSDGGPTAARFDGPRGLAFDQSGNLLVSDSSNARIRKVDPNGNVTTLAGTGTYGTLNGASNVAQFFGAEGITVDSRGNVLVADVDANQIRKIDSSGNVTTLAGSGTRGFADGPGATAQFKNPYDVEADGLGNVYVADANNNRIRRIDSSGNVTTLAGDGTYGFADGGAAVAQFKFPTGIALDGNSLFVADYSNYRVRRVDASVSETTTTTTTAVPSTTSSTTAVPVTTTSSSSSTTAVPVTTTTSTTAVPVTTTSTTSTTSTTAVPASTSTTTVAETSTSTTMVPEVATSTTTVPEIATSTTSAPDVTTSTTTVAKATTGAAIAPETTAATTTVTSSTNATSSTTSPDATLVYSPITPVPSAAVTSTSATVVAEPPVATVSPAVGITPETSAVPLDAPSVPTTGVSTEPATALALSASAVNVGDTVTVTGEGYLPGSKVTIELHSDPVVFGTADVRSNGSFTFTAALPAGIVGKHRIVVQGFDAIKGPMTADLPLTISPRASSTTNELAFTGGEARVLTMCGFGMIALGLFFRRRNNHARG